MAPHTGFLVAAVLSFVITLPAMLWQWRTRLPHRIFSATLYLCGYLLIGAAFVFDAVVQPPLFIHGFVPGIGTGMIAVALAMGLRMPVGRRPQSSSRTAGHQDVEA